MEPETLLIIFSDLDGTLLDHQTYDYAPARPAIDRLKRNDSLVIFTTSKTWPETIKLQDQIGVEGPCIVENGVIMGLPSALEPLIEPTGSELCTPADYDNICQFVEHLPNHLNGYIKGFAQMSDIDIAEATGLTIEGARLAKQRAASEPFLWTGTTEQLDILKDLASASGLSMTQGGRFYHLHKGQEKSRAAETLTKAYSKLYPKRRIVTCALGDAPNDFAMLAFADHGFLVTNPNTPGLKLPLHFGHASIVRTQSPGPTGWATAVSSLMDELSFAP